MNVCSVITLFQALYVKKAIKMSDFAYGQSYKSPPTQHCSYKIVWLGDKSEEISSDKSRSSKI